MSRLARLLRHVAHTADQAVVGIADRLAAGESILDLVKFVKPKPVERDARELTAEAIRERRRAKATAPSDDAPGPRKRRGMGRGAAKRPEPSEGQPGRELVPTRIGGHTYMLDPNAPPDPPPLTPEQVEAKYRSIGAERLDDGRWWIPLSEQTYSRLYGPETGGIRVIRTTLY